MRVCVCVFVCGVASQETSKCSSRFLFFHHTVQKFEDGAFMFSPHSRLVFKSGTAAKLSLNFGALSKPSWLLGVSVVARHFSTSALVSVLVSRMVHWLLALAWALLWQQQVQGQNSAFAFQSLTLLVPLTLPQDERILGQKHAPMLQ